MIRHRLETRRCLFLCIWAYLLPQNIHGFIALSSHVSHPANAYTWKRVNRAEVYFDKKKGMYGMKTLQKWMVTASVCLSLFLFAGLASAHVTVQPPEVPANSYQVFTVRVPSESKGVNTVKIQVKVAEGAAVTRVEPKQGWTYELEKDANDAIIGVTWTTEGAGLSETEFTEFRMSGKVNEDAQELVWKAYQTYSDNSLVEWVGADGADKPASVTKVTAAVASSDGHGTATAAESAETDSSDSNLPLILSILAVVLGAAALGTALAKRKK